MKIEEILKQLCKYMNENDDKLCNEEFSRLYQAKELIKEAMVIESIEKINKRKEEK